MELFICTRSSDLSQLDRSPTKEFHILYLRERIAFEHRKEPWTEAQGYTEYITASDYDDARRAIQKLWQDIVENETRTDLDHYEYHFCNCYTAVYFWELALRRAILSKQPQRIWISETIASSGRLRLPEDHVACLSTFNEWMLNRCILKVINECMLEARTLPEIQHKNKKGKKRILRLLKPPSLLTIERALWVNLPLNVKTIFSARASSKVLIIAQRSKTIRLERALKNQGIDYIFNSYKSAEKSVAKLHHKTSFSFSLDYDSTTSALDALVKWITEVSLYHDELFDRNIDTFLDSNKIRIIMTDGDHHPLVRRLNKYIKDREGFSILTMPEGGFDMDRQSSNETFRLKPHLNHIKCVLSEESLCRLDSEKSKFKDVIVMGYDTSLVLARLLAYPIRFAIKILTKNKYKGIIFYDYPCFTGEELGIIRTSRMPEIEALNLTDQISKKLADTDYLIISHLRRIDVYAKYFPSRFAHVGLHWSLLACIADVVISTNSSIVSECLSIRKPVLLWQPKSKAPSAYNYLTSRTPPLKVIMKISRLSELEPALNKLLNVVKGDFTESAYVTPTPNHRAIAKRIKLLLSKKG